MDHRPRQAFALIELGREGDAPAGAHGARAGAHSAPAGVRRARAGACGPGAGPTRAGSLDGFTLIELLVVISIVALLIALLLPALNGARAQARSVSCMSRLRNLVVATQSYRHDWKNWYPANNASWRDTINNVTVHAHVYVNQIRPYVNVHDPMMYVQHRSGTNFFLCPGVEYPGFPAYSTSLNSTLRGYAYISNGVRLTNYMMSGFFGYGTVAIVEGTGSVVPSTWRQKREIFGDEARLPMTLEIFDAEDGLSGQVGYLNRTSMVIYPHPGRRTNVAMTAGNVRPFEFSLADHLSAGTIAFSTTKYSGN